MGMFDDESQKSSNFVSLVYNHTRPNNKILAQNIATSLLGIGKTAELSDEGYRPQSAGEYAYNKDYNLVIVDHNIVGVESDSMTVFATVFRNLSLTENGQLVHQPERIAILTDKKFMHFGNLFKPDKVRFFAQENFLRHSVLEKLYKFFLYEV